MPSKVLGGTRSSAKSRAFGPGGNSMTNTKPLFNMKVKSLVATKNIVAGEIDAPIPITIVSNPKRRIPSPSPDFSSFFSFFSAPDVPSCSCTSRSWI